MAAPSAKQMQQTAMGPLKVAQVALRGGDSGKAGVSATSASVSGLSAKQRQAQALKLRADEARVQQLRGIFAAYDEDRDGLLNELELGSALLALGLEPSVKMLQRFGSLSASGVNLESFVKTCMARASGPSPAVGDSTYESILSLFRSLDEGGRGRVPLAMLLHVLAEVAAPSALTMAEVQDLLRMSGILTPAVAADPRLLYSMEIEAGDFVRMLMFVPPPRVRAAPLSPPPAASGPRKETRGIMAGTYLS
jgi:Ca2+-binding EF-hand superfamily protein